MISMIFNIRLSSHHSIITTITTISHHVRVHRESAKLKLNTSIVLIKCTSHAHVIRIVYVSSVLPGGADRFRFRLNILEEHFTFGSSVPKIMMVLLVAVQIATGTWYNVRI